jgi:type I restriction enzyme S subunit
MAEEIYREWFVRMRFPGASPGTTRAALPDDWAEIELPRLASITYGFAFAGERFTTVPVGKKIIRIRDVLSGDSKDYTDEVVNEKYIVKAGDLLIGMDGDFHMNHWVAEDAYLVQRTCRIAPKDERLRGYLAFALKAPIYHYQQTIVGATVGHLGAKHLNAISLLVPPEDLNRGLETINQMLDQRLTLSKQNLQLAKTRDALLPRLISGKLRVDQLNIQTPPSMRAETAQAV